MVGAAAEALAGQELDLPFLPRVPNFSFETGVPINFHSLVYIPFENRVSLTSILLRIPVPGDFDSLLSGRNLIYPSQHNTGALPLLLGDGMDGLLHVIHLQLEPNACGYHVPEADCEKEVWWRSL